MSSAAARNTGQAPTVPDADVVIIGHGPVGATLALLLARRGHRVVVLERRLQRYTLPRATSFDGETARLLAATGLGPTLGAIGEPATGYEWRNAGGRSLLRIEFRPVGPYGWPDATTMHQPTLEEALIQQQANSGLAVRYGHTVVGVADFARHVEVTAETPDGRLLTFRARWAVGCDGANSIVRAHLDPPVTDLGFSYDWLLCDVVMRRPRRFAPTNIQICDPARPTTLVGSGPGRRRWEFMRLPGETVAELGRPDTAWRLLAPYGVTQGTADLVRSAVYTFRASWAEQWRGGHVLIAGDAAHLMPPFAGQGMCSGIRDAANLAWKLELVLRGQAGEPLLDSYAIERRHQVKDSILASVKLGRVICVSDPAAAADRDAAMMASPRSRTATAPEPAKPLPEGLLSGGPAAGHVVLQARVARGDCMGLFDEIAGIGFVLLSAIDPRPAFDDARLGFLASLPARIVHLLPRGQLSGTGGDEQVPGVLRVVDIDDVYRPYLERFGVSALLIRPDYHIFGSAASPAGLAALVDKLRTRLGAPAERARGSASPAVTA